MSDKSILFSRGQVPAFWRFLKSLSSGIWVALNCLVNNIFYEFVDWSSALEIEIRFLLCLGNLMKYLFKISSKYVKFSEEFILLRY